MEKEQIELALRLLKSIESNTDITHPDGDDKLDKIIELMEKQIDLSYEILSRLKNIDNHTSNLNN